MLYGFICLNDPVNFVDPYGLNQTAVDFVEGFVSPGPPPPTPGGAAGYAARQAVNQIIDLDEAADAVQEAAGNAWEAYYKEDINRNWKNDPNSPYYEEPGPKEYYWESNSYWEYPEIIPFGPPPELPWEESSPCD